MVTQGFLEEMGQRIAARRRYLGLTQEQVAEQMEVSLQMVSNLEHGKKAIRPENLARLCQVLQTNADYILTGQVLPSSTCEVASRVAQLSPRDYEIIVSLIDRLIE